MQHHSRLAALFLPALLLAAPLPAADFAIGVAAGPGSGKVSDTNLSGLLVSGQSAAGPLFNAAFDFATFKSASLAVELPLAAHLATNATILAYPSSLTTAFYTERTSLIFTPGLRIKANLHARFAPWASFGAGMARVNRTGTLISASTPSAFQAESKFMPALAPAAGADFRIAGPFSLRAEFRAYATRTPQSGFTAAESRWNHWQFTPVAALSLVFSH